MNLNYQNRILKSPAGFTLLEVLISMAVLVFISFSIYQATIQTYKLRDSLSTEGGFHNGIRLSMSLMQRDFSLIYSPIIGVPEKKSNPGDPPPNLNVDNLDLSMQYWSPAIDETGIRPSHFIGTDTRVSFISASHIRIYRDSAESEFAKISYELKSDQKKDAKSGTSVLIKTESSNVFLADNSPDTYKHSYDILSGIRKFSYTYYKRDGNTWKTSRSWDSEKENPKSNFPDFIELAMEVVGPQDQVFEGNFRFRPEIPLNGLVPSF